MPEVKLKSMMNATSLKITLLFIFDDRNDGTVERRRRMLDILEKISEARL